MREVGLQDGAGTMQDERPSACRLARAERPGRRTNEPGTNPRRVGRGCCLCRAKNRASGGKRHARADKFFVRVRFADRIPAGITRYNEPKLEM